MLQAAQPFAIPDFSAFAATIGHERDTEGQRIRFAAADLVRQGRLADADLLTRAALQHYPDSEDVLIIRALVCEVRQDWKAAVTVLTHLVELQGAQTPAETWCHWVRVLRCDGQLTSGLKAVLKALKLHPSHPALASELAQLEALGVHADRKAA